MGHRLRFYHGLAALVMSSLFLVFLGGELQRQWGLWGLVATELGLLLIVAVGVLVLKPDLREMFPFAMPKVQHVFGAMSLWVGAYIFVAAISYVQLMFFPDILKESQALASFMSNGSPLLRLLSVAILPAVCEELLHRGFIRSSMNSIRSDVLRSVVVGLLFGAFHLSVFRFLPTAILGIAITFAMIRSQTLIVPMFLHFLNNCISLMPAPTQPVTSVDMEAIVTMPQIPLIFLSFAIMPTLLGIWLLQPIGKRPKTWMFLVGGGVSVTLFVVAVSMTAAMVASGAVPFPT